MSAPLRVLLIDDNADPGRDLSPLDGPWGYETRVARDGPTALAVAAEFLPDVALLDIELTGMPGCEVARRLRALPGLGDIVLVALTVSAEELPRRQCDGAGFAFYFV